MDYFERFLGICEDAEADDALPNDAYRDMMYDMARTALDKARSSMRRRPASRLVEMLERDVPAKAAV
jgi:hypothetical protein